MKTSWYKITKIFTKYFIYCNQYFSYAITTTINFIFLWLRILFSFNFIQVTFINWRLFYSYSLYSIQVCELQKFILLQTFGNISKSFSIRTCITFPSSACNRKRLASTCNSSIRRFYRKFVNAMPASVPDIST